MFQFIIPPILHLIFLLNSLNAKILGYVPSNFHFPLDEFLIFIALSLLLIHVFQLIVTLILC